MGSRVNFVIIEQGQWELFYDHWAATHIHIDLFWGPDAAIEYIRQIPPADPQNDWLDDIWCEGAALLDLDHKVLIWFGHFGNHAYELRAYHLLLQQAWPGWRIHKAFEGVATIARYLNLPLEPFLKLNYNDPDDIASGELRPRLDEDFALESLDEYDVYIEKTLISVRDAQGIRYARVRVGNNLVLREADFPLILKHLCDDPSIFNIDEPSSGIHFDHEQRKLYFWRTQEASQMTSWLVDAWPSWQVNVFAEDDAFWRHLQLAQIDINQLSFSLKEQQQECLRDIRSYCVHTVNKSIDSLVQRFEAEGKTVEVNPYTSISRGSVRDQGKYEYLDALEARLPITE